MRLTRLLVVVLLVLVAGRTAVSQNIKESTAKPSFHSDYWRPFAATNESDGRWLRQGWSYSTRGTSSPGAEGFQNDTCLTLRTLVVARDYQQSDSTHLVSQRTCTPARQFQMKSAVVNSSGQK